ncbi:pyruvate/2-oxoglutarate dehydrogenase complex, dihydrolipoamide dehydrogenase E3 component [Legionella oakridgensis ATCC 33761 = DSM 21215]|uniref:Pyruvate/2-oxoglutarate dehydrogenase complex, dihydrolipoamide dehydrogenase E3 component n=1 Tax=Legionella oakridgensis ATCC 33761 = DSM 21215 TaxID=1268635 RepID=W0BE17_9GAMM|nr:FAD-dependent oxidoreductase [Legionella oakridgensis]AHE68115.1 pyruvate/2-oxoglutarate dehydrogenase complex, dihydrolipoamide dehydrogenase E3 component [Legionella oakridgensis ATCC 33761 = DSM 21215]
MKQVIHCDIAILGAGSGGLSLASGAAQLGAKVVLVESDKMGGDCLNYGCIPSKSLLAAAKSVYHTKHTNYVDIQTDALEVDFSKVMEHVRTVVATIGKHDSVERFESLGVQVIKASGKFIGPNVLQANDYFIHAKYFVIATGSSPFIPPIIGLDKIIYETNETIFNLNHLPAHLIVIGGGPIGCELAQAFLMLGSQVTLLEAATILPHDDKDCVAILREQFKRMGMVLHEKSEVQKVEQTDKEQITVHVKKGRHALAYKAVICWWLQEGGRMLSICAWIRLMFVIPIKALRWIDV